MTIPSEIPFSSVIVADRIRVEMSRIDDLADNIAEVGLIQPLVLRQDGDGFRLVAGGRRHAALAALGTTTLFHATTGDPSRPGFILAGEEHDVLRSLLSEINENLNREDVDWRDNLRGVMKAYNLASAQENEKGRALTIRTFSDMVGYPASDMLCASAIWRDFNLTPELFKDASTLRAAYGVLLRRNAQLLEKEQVARMKSVSIHAESRQVPEVQPDLEAPASESPPLVVPLTTRFHHGDSLTFLATCGRKFDHIICDPDYGVAKEMLAVKGWSPDTSSVGVAQDSVEESLAVLYDFINVAFSATHDHSFLVFFYDLDHHEKLQRCATNVGWSVQRWPLIWHKTDFRGNAAPGFNFCKNMEYAMICRKPGATLTGAQTSSVFPIPGDAASREFNHPFAKPRALWQRIFSAVATRGQSVFDPFMGSGSSCLAALDYGLDAHGMELQEQHYNVAISNLQQHYRKALGSNVSFT